MEKGTKQIEVEEFPKDWPEEWLKSNYVKVIGG
jgi:hypothetical protein